MDKEKYFSEAMDILSARRQNAASVLEKRRNEIFQKLPIFEELEQQFIQSGIQIAKTNNIQTSNLEKLEKEMQGLLLTAGYPFDYLQLQYHCNLCKDTGFINGNLCSCTQDLIKKIQRYEISNGSPLSLSSFSTFSLKYYSTDHDKNFNIIPRKHMEAVLEFCKDYAEDFHPNSDNLLFMGTAGLGKTHLALAIASCVLEKGYDVIYLSAQAAFSQIEQEKFNTREEILLPAILSADLLVLDDLGTEYLSPYIVSELYRIIESRMAARKPTIYTTNLNAENALSVRYTEKIASRLLGGCQLIHFFGSDIRLLKNMPE